MVVWIRTYKLYATAKKVCGKIRKRTIELWGRENLRASHSGSKTPRELPRFKECHEV